MDPEKALEAKERGNEQFRAGQWALAISEYEEVSAKCLGCCHCSEDIMVVYRPLKYLERAQGSSDESLTFRDDTISQSDTMSPLTENRNGSMIESMIPRRMSRPGCSAWLDLLDLLAEDAYKHLTKHSDSVVCLLRNPGGET